MVDSFSFEWDEGNKDKNWYEHKVSAKECEEVFFNKQIIIYQDIKHSLNEERFGLLGRTTGNRLLHIIFTIRKGNIRIISARDMNKKERSRYEEK